MRFKEARHHQVVSTGSATKVGRVERFVVLAGPARVAAVVLGKVEGDGTLVGWGDLTGFGRDAVTIADTSLIRAPADEDEERITSKDLDVMGKLVLTERGDSLGKVDDVDFDLSTGAVTKVITKREEIAGERIIGVGRYAVVVAV